MTAKIIFYGGVNEIVNKTLLKLKMAVFLDFTK
jgi:hypothetical protein